MNVFGRDCGCEARKQRLQAFLRRRLAGLLGLETLGVGFGEHLLSLRGHLTGRLLRHVGGLGWRFPASRLLHLPSGLYVVEAALDLGPNTITNAAADFLAYDFVDASTDVTNMNYHHWGTGSCSSPVGCAATSLVTPGSEARVSGTKSRPAAGQYRTVATLTADASKTITEWGLFSASSGGTAWSLRCFTGIALATNDGIEFTYTLTISCVQA